MTGHKKYIQFSGKIVQSPLDGLIELDQLPVKSYQCFPDVVAIRMFGYGMFQKLLNIARGHGRSTINITATQTTKES